MKPCGKSEERNLSLKGGWRGLRRFLTKLRNPSREESEENCNVVHSVAPVNDLQQRSPLSALCVVPGQGVTRNVDGASVPKTPGIGIDG